MQQDILKKLYAGKYISYLQCKNLFKAIIKKKITSIQLASILISMKTRGESVEEITGAAEAMLESAKYFPRPNYLFSDIAGTGGDNSNSINISTTSAIVASCCDINIAKHHNKKISSITGSADLLKSFNIKLNISPKKTRTLLDKFKLCFLFAPYYYESLDHIKNVRKQLNTPTLLNIIGPMINPAKPPLILMGVYKKELITLAANTLKVLGFQRAAIVHCDGMDEISLHAPTQVAELHNQNIYNYNLTAKDFGLHEISIKRLHGGSIQKNHEIVTKILQGKGDIAQEHTIAANVAMLLKLFGKEDLRDNTKVALDIIKSGMPYKQLINLIKKGS